MVVAFYCAGMTDEGAPVPGLPNVEMREVSFPDGTRGVIAVARGLSQDEADLLAARGWADLPE